MNAKARLQTLNAQWHGCTKCDLHLRRPTPHICFGGGAAPATYLIVGDAPNTSDENEGVVFSGEVSDILLEALTEAGIAIADCYFTYAVACRPKVYIPATDGEAERIEDRAPAREELNLCRPRLYEILYQVDPRVIITTGEWATKTMLRGRLPKYLDVVGKQYTCVLPSADPEDHAEGKTTGKARYHDLRYPMFAIPTPAAILMNTSEAAHGPHQILKSTLQRAHALVQFVLNAEHAPSEKSP